MVGDLSHHTDLLLRWYSVNKRKLPWRQTQDPYKVWLSEVILQQTRVAQGLPYYNKFIERFPSVHDLSNASIQEVLLHWQGLGYYTRARNLHKCAKTIVSEFDGIFPGSYSELIRLPGIGPYTAAAIASISFNEEKPVIDGNVFRVLSRLFDINEEIHSLSGRKYFEKLANIMIPSKNPGDFNQAIMEFGALQCIPKNPGCDICDLRSLCLSYSNKNQHERPVHQKKTYKSTRYFDYLVFEDEKGLYLQKREKKDIWKGLYDFYLLESKTKKNDLTEILRDNKLFRNIDLHVNHIREYKHILTHQIIFATFYHVRFTNYHLTANILLNTGKFYSLNEIEALPKPVLIDKYLKEEIF